MDKTNRDPFSGSSPVVEFFGILLRLFGIYAIGLALISLIFKFILHTGLPDFDSLIESSASPEAKQNLLLLIQFLAPLIQFILLPLLYLIFFKTELIPFFKIRTYRSGAFLLLGLFLYFSFLPALEYLIQWNQNLHLPEAWKGLETEMSGMEEKAKKITDLLINYHTKGKFFLVLLVVAVLPAVGEELFFRGLMQNEIRVVTRSPHFAIWFTAIAFSFVHFQFYGFIPRMLLGVLFGYLYFWSGNILIPITLHFLNNAATLIIMNLYRESYEKLESQQGTVSPVFALISLVITIVMGFYVYNLYKERKVQG